MGRVRRLAEFDTDKLAQTAQGIATNVGSTAQNAWQGAKTLGAHAFKGAVDLATDAGLDGTGAQVAAGTALAIGGAATLYGAKKIGGMLFSANKWGCECSLVKKKKESCGTCGSRRPHNGQDWYCNCRTSTGLCKLRDGKLSKCEKCKAYQMWICKNCANENNLDECDDCGTNKEWECDQCGEDISMNYKLCPKCEEGVRPRQVWESGVKFFDDGKEENSFLSRASKALETKDGDREWLHVFPNRLSGIIVLSTTCAMIFLSLILSCLFCKSKKRVRRINRTRKRLMGVSVR